MQRLQLASSMHHNYVAIENGSVATVTIGVVGGVLQREVSVDLSFLDVSVQGKHLFIISMESRVTSYVIIDGSDYTNPGVRTLVLTPTMSSFNIDVPLIDDTIFELTEAFNASLSFSAGETHQRVTIAAQISILDNDGEAHNYSLIVAIHCTCIILQ